jgi:hypothetical protein
VTYAKLDTAKISDLTDGHNFAVSCSSCRHGLRLTATTLRQWFPEEFPVVLVRNRLRCSKCGVKAVIVTYLTPDQASNPVTRLQQDR